ncbi:MAG: alpha/beta hydrolase, partial [Spirochaetota bacterium]
KSYDNKINWIVMGFSFGGLIATDFSLNCEFSEVKNVILFSPWIMTHKRLINNFTKLYLFAFHNFFNPKSLINFKIQEEVLKMDTESYILLNKNLTDNEEFLRIRKKDTRIFRVISKRRLAEIYKAQLRLIKTENKKNLKFYLFLPEKDIIVDSDSSEKLIRKFNGEIFYLKNSYHDFLDYFDDRWKDFIKNLNNCLTKIVK